MGAAIVSGTLSRLLSVGARRAASNDSKDAALGELEMELTLLREENARLKVEQHRPADAGRIVERMRSLGQGNGGEHDRQMTIEELAQVRDALAEACYEVRRSTHAIRDRLSTLSASSGGSQNGSPPQRGSMPSSTLGELEILRATEAGPPAGAPRMPTG